MNKVIRLKTHLSTAMLLMTLLTSCGAATTPASNGLTPTAQQAAGLEYTTPSLPPSTMTSIATSVHLTPTMAPTDEPDPTQMPVPTKSPVAPPMPTMPAPTSTEPVRQPAPDATVQVDIKLFQYQPDPMEIVVGTTVVWTNQDEAPHTVTHGTYVKRGGAFDSSTLKQDQSFTFTFDQVGNYMYTCIIHPEMVGTVKVVGS